jgi:hypothetical protein
MATLLIHDVNDRAVSEYDIASEEEKRQVKKVIEDVLFLWSHRRTKSASRQTEIGFENVLWQEMADFLTTPQTFSLDWEHHKLSREEMNER